MGKLHCNNRDCQEGKMQTQACLPLGYWDIIPLRYTETWGAFSPSPSIWLHFLSIPFTFSKNQELISSVNCTRLELMFLLFLPGTQFGSPVKLLFVLFTSEENTCDAIGKHCLSPGCFESRLPRVDSPGLSFELCCSNIWLLFIF